MTFCGRHARLLEDALELRGLEVALPGIVPIGFNAAYSFAKDLIVKHATHFAGKAAVDLLTNRWCPICFVNLACTQSRVENAAAVNCDGWVDNAAEETLEHEIALRDAPAPRVLVS